MRFPSVSSSAKNWSSAISTIRGAFLQLPRILWIRGRPPLARLCHQPSVRHGVRGKLGRVEVLPLHLHDDAMQGAIADLRQGLQQLGHLEQEGIAIVGGKRCRGGKDRHHLRISQGNRR
jgi:hypothetical protein